jgi:trehalose 6-phosphate phosphatase
MMRYLLAKANREVLEQYACSRTMLALDFDGTLAPIVADPARAAMRPATRRLLREAARAYPCVVLSGRARADAARRVKGAPVADVIGNHGMEQGRVPAGAVRQVRQWTRLLEEALGPIPGVAIEDKGVSLAVHYRGSRQKKRARARIFEAAERLGAVRLIGGKDVVNVLPAGAPHKGLALERARARFGCDTAIYLGDDDTDEDVFSLDQPGRLLAIRVGRSAASAAAYYVRSQAEVDRLLRRLVSLRPRAKARKAAGRTRRRP